MSSNSDSNIHDKSSNHSNENNRNALVNNETLVFIDDPDDTNHHHNTNTNTENHADTNTATTTGNSTRNYNSLTRVVGFVSSDSSHLLDRDVIKAGYNRDVNIDIDENMSFDHCNIDNDDLHEHENASNDHEEQDRIEISSNSTSITVAPLEASVVNEESLPVAVALLEVESVPSIPQIPEESVKAVPWYEARMPRWKLIFGAVWVALVGGIITAVLIMMFGKDKTDNNTLLGGEWNNDKEYGNHKVLLQLYNVTQGSKWKNNSGWGEFVNEYGFATEGFTNDEFNDFFCSFHGVSCAFDEETSSYRLTRLVLNDNNLNGAIIDVFSVYGQVVNGKKLDISSNDLLRGNVTEALEYLDTNNTNLKILNMTLNPGLYGSVPESYCYQKGDINDKNSSGIETILVDCDILCDCCSYLEPC